MYSANENHLNTRPPSFRIRFERETWNIFRQINCLSLSLPTSLFDIPECLFCFYHLEPSLFAPDFIFAGQKMICLFYASFFLGNLLHSFERFVINHFISLFGDSAWFGIFCETQMAIPLFARFVESEHGLHISRAFYQSVRSKNPAGADQRKKRVKTANAVTTDCNQFVCFNCNFDILVVIFFFFFFLVVGCSDQPADCAAAAASDCLLKHRLLVRLRVGVCLG